jgi:uncharacterized protein (UPF0276 family)
MKVGVNWSGHRDTAVLIKLLNDRDIDFVEILIDNFLCVDPRILSSILGGLPVNFHIMNSQFIHRKNSELQELAGIINNFSDVLQPEYISDHIGIFYHGKLPLPVMAEIDYSRDFDSVVGGLIQWQKYLGTRLLIENYPSAFEQTHKQAEFYDKLLSITGANLLFDVSNAVISELNIGYPVSKWDMLINECKNFHMAGYEFSNTKPVIAIDSHATNLSENSICHAKRILSSKDETITVTVERDDNLNHFDWLSDIRIVRSLKNNSY